MGAANLHLLLPPPRHWPAGWPDVLGAAMGRADRLDDGADAALGRLFGLPGIPASAALSRLGEGDVDLGEVQCARWLRADPAWIRADINGARLLGIGPMLAPDAADVDAFRPGLEALFEGEGIGFSMPHPARAYLMIDGDEALPRFSTPSEALGADPFDHRPEGGDARRWRRLDSEAQVFLHQHPWQATRQQRGRHPMNALWFWGDQPLPDAVTSQVPMLASDDPLLRGLGRLANLPVEAVPDAWRPGVQGVVDLRGQPVSTLVEGWLRPALDGLGRNAMQWICEDGPVLLMRRAQRWRVWRRPIDATSMTAPAE